LLFCVHFLFFGFCSLVFNVASDTEILHSYIISTLPAIPRTTCSNFCGNWMDIALAHDHIAKKRTIVLSGATSSAKDGLDMLKVPETGASWPNKPALLEEFLDLSG
jgi:hypothetical protein